VAAAPWRAAREATPFTEQFNRSPGRVTMNRSRIVPVAAAALSVALASAAPVLAQAAGAQPAAPQAATAPPARAKWVAPIKGLASVEVIKGDSRKVGNDVVTVLKVKNMSNAPIAGFRADETWFDKSRKVVSGDTYRHRQPLQPGEVLEFSFKSPVKPDLYVSSINFVHANGKIDAKAVKVFKK
jgi:hypothetical protein